MHDVTIDPIFLHEQKLSQIHNVEIMHQGTSLLGTLLEHPIKITMGRYTSPNQSILAPITDLLLASQLEKMSANEWDAWLDAVSYYDTRYAQIH